ncbi:hypothetical protein [Streptomyces sp. SID4982]|uniref:hypothetical protein n=1 Tax=Streptomyces sp. SID4982 TaxID=2690291 RepID=UPI00136A747F|nr:hypothetical protein [Streptomyces sp. SID4982]MYS16125.1 hypothetical protein [Streptomyces sp. SID4982]
MSEHDSRSEICRDCEATPENRDARIITSHKDEQTGRYYTVETWHHDDCPTYTVDQILLEEGARKAKENTAWGLTEFPAAHERLLEAVGKADLPTAAQPFVTALIELVGAQGADLGRIVLPERWAEILNRHFPPPAPTA